MLRFLSVRDFVIVDALELAFEPGFTVLTGETGAGKSILIDALALALGERGEAGVVRQGMKQADIGAEFDSPESLVRWLAEQGLEGDEGRCLLRRVIDGNGRSRAFINGRLVTLAQLREAGEFLIDIHGQHAHLSLVRADAQRDLLDAHAGLGGDARDVAAAFAHWKHLRDALAQAASNAKQLAEERDRVAWQVDELHKIAPLDGEWDEVQREQTRLSHAASLLEGTQGAVDALAEADDALTGKLGAVLSRLEALADYDPSLRNVIETLKPAQIGMQEAARELSQYLRHTELDPERLARTGARVEALHGAGRKYRVAPGDLPAELARLRARLAELQLSADIEALEREAAAAREAYLKPAGVLGTKRVRAAKKLGAQVTAAMQDLALAGGRFEVALQALDEGAAHGLERVEFLIAGHAGVEPRPLARVASGGELSRMGLAIQVIASRAARVPTLIFDEVDAGIGGAVAETIGKMLKALGGERQVLCVTHLAQVASQGDTHWRVAKRAAEGSVVSTVAILGKAERVEEVARMLGGAEITPTTRKAAREMLAA